MEIIKRLYKQSVIILVPLAVASAFIEPKKLPAGIIAGGLLGLLNLKGLAWGLGNLLGTHKPTAKLVVLSMFRLLLLFVAIALLAYFRLINLIGLLVGMTVVFTLLMKEGFLLSKRMAEDDTDDSGGDTV